MAMENKTIYTMHDLLLTDAIRYNQTKLSKLLKVHRNTASKFTDDRKGEYHVIIRIDSVYKFFSSPSTKVN